VQVCRKGQLLDPNQAALLRVFGIKMATFRITPLAWWSSEGKAPAGVDTLLTQHLSMGHTTVV
jgi:hypothetical protein